MAKNNKELKTYKLNDLLSKRPKFQKIEDWLFENLNKEVKPSNDIEFNKLTERWEVKQNAC